MIIKGLQELSLIDYPGTACATLFIFGCNLKCPYCHNPELVDINATEKKEIRIYTEEEILSFLSERKDFLEGVCITGGEPTLCKGLPSFLKKIKKLGYKVKLDTNGTNPEMLSQLIEDKDADYIAMDIKAPLEKYQKITKSKIDVSKIIDSIEIIKKMDNYEFRTTIIPDLKKKDVIKIAELINGARAYYLQQFVPNQCLDEKYCKKKPHDNEFFNDLKEEISHSFEICEIRNYTY